MRGPKKGSMRENDGCERAGPKIEERIRNGGERDEWAIEIMKQQKRETTNREELSKLKCNMKEKWAGEEGQGGDGQYKYQL